MDYNWPGLNLIVSMAGKGRILRHPPSSVASGASLGGGRRIALHEEKVYGVSEGELTKGLGEEVRLLVC